MKTLGLHITTIFRRWFVFMKAKKQRQRTRGQKPIDQIKIARERMNFLVQKAEDIHVLQPELARRYYQLAKKIGMRYNVRIPGGQKRKFCRYCFSFLDEGWRLKNGTAAVTCRNCGKTMRYPYRPKKK
jgi:ribonuclease P protein subunit RPR2